MSRWITYDYKCSQCDSITTELVERSDVPEHIPCVCGGSANRTLSANITRVSYVDGNDRFKYAKEKRALDKLAREARKAGNKEEAARIKQEISVVRETSTRDRKSSNICKVEAKEK